MRTPDLAKEDQKRVNYLVTGKIQTFLDSGCGDCLLKEDNVAEIVARALAHFERERYENHGWCIMPNHVHWVVSPIGPFELSDTLHSIKSFSAHSINRFLKRTGKVWSPEYYDHLVRNAGSYDRVLAYVADNPVKAGLNSWKWVWPEGVR